MNETARERAIKAYQVYPLDELEEHLDNLKTEWPDMTDDIKLFEEIVERKKADV